MLPLLTLLSEVLLSAPWGIFLDLATLDVTLWKEGEGRRTGQREKSSCPTAGWAEPQGSLKLKWPLALSHVDQSGWALVPSPGAVTGCGLPWEGRLLCSTGTLGGADSMPSKWGSGGEGREDVTYSDLELCIGIANQALNCCCKSVQGSFRLWWPAISRWCLLHQPGSQRDTVKRVSCQLYWNPMWARLISEFFNHWDFKVVFYQSIVVVQSLSHVRLCDPMNYSIVSFLLGVLGCCAGCIWRFWSKDTPDNLIKSGDLFETTINIASIIILISAFTWIF